MHDWFRKVAMMEVDRGATVVAWALSFMFNSENGRCWATKATIGEATRLKPDTVKKALKALEDARLIERRTEDGLRVIYPCQPVFDGQPWEREETRREERAAMRAPIETDDDGFPF